MDGDLMRPEGVAKWLGVHGNTVRNWLKRGLMPCYRTRTGYYFVDRADVEHFLRFHPTEEENEDG